MKRILFLRHGESVADLINHFEGWTDFELTDKGKQQTYDRIPDIKNLNIPFEIVISSPFKRAKAVAEIISSELNLPMDIFEYLKEVNATGVLAGMNRDEAKEKYPDQIEALYNEGYVDGSETKEQRHDRVRKTFKKLALRPEENIIVVSHGGFAWNMLEMYWNKRYKKMEDLGYMLLEMENDEPKLVSVDGLMYEDIVI